jgi:glycosyltransferase involved in cell wall biosynthesis
MLKKQFKIGVCGYFGNGNSLNDGQSIRTLSVTREIEKELGQGNVRRISYHNLKRRPVQFLLNLLLLLIKSENIVLFPAHNAIKLLIPMTITFKNLFNTKVYYNVIGGWLPTYLSKHRWLLPFIKQLDGLFVQTSNLKDKLTELGVENVHVFPNFKDIKIYHESELPNNLAYPLRLCFFSRVTEKKGVAEMVEVIKEINKSNIKYTLDIYGQVSNDYQKSFKEIQTNLPSYINYKGVIDGWKASEVIKDYNMQLFPTKYWTEGFPGSILDSFCAGVPVLASRWESYKDVIEEGANGITFEFNNFDMMKEKLEDIYNKPESIIDMKVKCLEKAHSLKPEVVIKIMTDVILGGKK